MQLIHDALHKALVEQPPRRRDNILWVSDLGRNPYGALRRILTGEVEPFDYPTLLKMDGGSAFESSTLRQVAEQLERPVWTQFPLFSDVWTGYADIVIGHGTEDVIIYDHKGSAGKWWDYKGSLPRAADCCQVWMYGQLYQEMYGILPRTGLYYRGWGAWAEFQVEVLYHDGGEAYIHATGVVTSEKGLIENDEVNRFRKVDPALLRNELETLYFNAQAGNITIDRLNDMDPDGPDWDYAEEATTRLRRNP